MRLNQLTVAINLVLKRPLFDEEKAVYEHKKLDFQTQFIKSARQLGRTQHFLKEVERLKEKSRIICSTLGLPRHLLGERNDFEFIDRRAIDRDWHQAQIERAFQEHQIGLEKLNPEHVQKMLDEQQTVNTFVERVSKKPLAPWQKQFLGLAIRAKQAGKTLTILPRPRGRKLVNLSVTICAFDVMRDLAQSEFEKATLLKREVAKDFILLPFINHYLDRTVFFAQLSQQTNNIVHLNKAYKRAHLVCMVVKYFLKDKHSNLEPSARLIKAMRKGLYL